MPESERPVPDDVVLQASTVGLGVVLRSLAPALEQVTLQQYRVLVLLVTRGPMRSGDLAAELGLLPSGTTRIVDRLVRARYVEKRTSRSSGREVIVTARAAATDLVSLVLDARRAELREMLRAMTPDERASIATTAAAVVRVGGPVPLDAGLMLAELPDQAPRTD